jgi:hypothetical protein
VVDRARAARVQAAIDQRARLEGAPVSVTHVCQACTEVMRACGVSLSLVGNSGVYEPIYATDARGERLTEWQVTVGEGPGITALAADRPVLAPDLDSRGSQRRWPLFAPQAVADGIQAVLAMPLRLGASAVGMLEISWDAEGWRRPSELADALLFADAALLAVITPRVPTAAGTEDPAQLGDGLIEGHVQRWPVARRSYTASRGSGSPASRDL